MELSNETENIVNGDLDIYAFLEVKENAELNEIRRQYRRKALQYHPDKNSTPEAAKTFHLLSTIYEVLTNESLRERYSQIRHSRGHRLDERERFHEQAKKFKEDLERAEQEYNFNSKAFFDQSTKAYIDRSHLEKKLELLNEEGLKKRRRQEKKIRKHSLHPRGNGIYQSFREFERPQERVFFHGYGDDELGKYETIVKWKHKDELKDLFTDEILLDLMSIFGTVLTANISPPNPQDRYDSGIVVFGDSKSAMRATQHDYRKSAILWDGTKFRKLASLLRECKPVRRLSDTLQHTFKYDEAYMNQSQRKPIPILPEYGVESSLIQRLNTEDNYVISTLKGLIQKEGIR